MSIAETINRNRLMLSGLCIYRKLLNDPIISAFRALITSTCKRPHISVEAFMESYSDFFNKLSQVDPIVNFPRYVFSRIILDENAFTLSASKPEIEMSPVIYDAAGSDICSLRSMISIKPSDIRNCYIEEKKENTTCLSIINALPDWMTLQSEQSLQPLKERRKKGNGHFGQSSSVAEKNTQKDDLWQLWNTNVTGDNFISSIMHYHSRNGSGIFAGHFAFTWQRTEAGTTANMKGPGYLAPVLNPDPIRLSDLIAYESEREEVIKNTEQFLDGCQANNVLLYGDRGTGKSSTVKALLNEYSHRGLRMIEVPKQMLVDFPKIVSLLAEQPHKFILFADDLSFENNEDSFTALKAVIEGGLEVKPKNVLIYATSNRKHLIKETFSDRIGLQFGEQDDEIRALDTMQEKLSLADRFGITVVFASPDKKRFLEIVDKLAQKKGIDMDTETLHKEALKWELWYNGRSPRTAQQFINSIGNP